MKERIYLVGFMGAGKTTVGKQLARQLNYRFIDMDDFFEMKYKINIHTFFDKYDEELFRSLEHERLIKTFDMKNVVVATGGGTPCYFNGIEKMNEYGASVYLEMSSAALAKRLMDSKTIRPLVRGKSGDELQSYIDNKLDERLQFYKKARLIIDGHSVDIQSLIERLELL